MSHSVGRADVLNISPTFKPSGTGGHNKKENVALVPVLSLVQFSRSPFVTFGTMKLGSSKSLPLRIENPTDDAVVTVTVDKIPSAKGFSIDQSSFTIQPEDSVIIAVTWTPTEEGGVRELISFTANGIIKHQAVLLGKAEAAKTKKKSLWDSIKSKRDPTKVGKVGLIPIEAANKTFHVSRQLQCKSNRRSNPLSPLNQERTSRRQKSRKENSRLSVYPQFPQALSSSVHDKPRSMYLQNNSPVVVLVPADRLLDAVDKENSPCIVFNKADYKEVRLLNKTLSPINTPERFGNPPMCIQSPLPVICKRKDEGQQPKTPRLSIKDALAIIESDLSHAVSPPNACSSFNLIDSLESGKSDCEPEAAISPVESVSPQTDIVQPRLTFVVKSNKRQDGKSVHNGFMSDTAFCSATITKSSNRARDDVEHESLKPRIHFNSATVTKSKPDASDKHSESKYRMRTSRRRLLQKTASVSDSSAESDSDLGQGVSVLPVINCDKDVDFKCNRTSTQVSQNQLMPPQSDLSDPVLISTFSVPHQPMVPLNAECNFSGVVSSVSPSKDCQSLPYSVSLDLSLECNPTAKQNRKRKSEELRDNSNYVINPFEVKQSCVMTHHHKKACPEKGFSSRNAQTRRKPTAAPSLRKTIKALPKKSNPISTQPGGQAVSTSRVKSAKVIAVAQSHLNFIKPTQSALPRHPLPFAAKNMFYDERWIEKQERGFTWWMNYVLTPDDFKVATEVTKVNALSLTMGSETFNIPKPPTKEEMSLRTYMARRRLNRLRRAACHLFTSDGMVKAIKRLELEVEAKRLLVRKDRHLWKDIGERQKVLNWLLSYNPLWLRIGLETVFGELISLESNNDIMGLAMFILARLLWNPDIAAEFRHPKVPHLYRDGHEEALSQFTLKKLLLLICFLDKAKESRLIEHDPCLFCMDAEFKTSKDLLLAFSRDFLSGEGILSRHLGLLGLPVSHVQTPLAEFNYAVQNLATDLRCGIRLVRIMEIFTQNWTLSTKLRMPAISRLQKVHNVNIALQVLREKGVDLRDEHGLVEARDIVDGHREKTLSLLWKIIFSFQIEVLLDLEQLKEEISFLRKTWKTKQKLIALKADNCVVQNTTGQTTFEHPSKKLTLLMDWVNAVCDFYGLKAENFTVSFSDGRVLCYLIHHYHPSHLQVEHIQQETTQTIECGHRGKLELNTSSSDSDCSFDSLEQKSLKSLSVDFKVLLENERSNFELVSKAVFHLGGVPAMINPEDMSNTIPNEKVVTSYLSFLCARLLDLRNETRAARVIQSAWRRYKLQKDIHLSQLRNQAACKIQSLVRCFLHKRRLNRQNKAASIIQAFWRGHSARIQLRQMREAKHFAIRNTAAILIQAVFRKWLARQMARRTSAALKIQAWYRMKECQKQYLALKSTAINIQAWFRGSSQRRKFQMLKKRYRSAIIIQSAFRAFHVRKQISEMRQAAVIIQRWYKACLLRNTEKRRYKEMKSAATTLQAAFHGWKSRRDIAQRQQAALVIQTAYRASVARRTFLSLRRSVAIAQQRYRAKKAGETLKKEYQALKCAAIKIQALWKGRAERRISQLHRCATVIQSHYRRHVIQTKYKALKQAALVIQRRYQAFRVGRQVRYEFLVMRNAVVVLQSGYRGMRIRQDVVKKNKAATIIQAAFFAFRCRQQFTVKRNAAIVIQKHYRAYALGQSERVHYLQIRESTIRLQAIYRGCKERRKLKKKHQAATVIQAHFRMYKLRVSFLAVKCAATIVQQCYRAHVLGRCTRSSYLQLKMAAVTLQSSFRGMKVRKSLQKMHRAAAVIQTGFRGHLQYVKYKRQKWAATFIQRRFRINKLTSTAEKQYKAMKEATVRIQSAYRGMVVRKQISKMQRAARVIQRGYRTYKQCSEYRALKQATVAIQRKYRAKVFGNKQHKRYCSMRKAAITLQAAYRGMKARREIHKRQRAATLIQAWYKMYREQMPFQAMRLAAVLIQRHYRCHLRRKEAREHFLKLRHTAIAMQAVFRGNRTRRGTAAMHSAATLIQRKYLACKERKRFLSIKAAAEICQQKYRANLLARQERKVYLDKRNAAIAIQAGFRGMKVRQQMQIKHNAARTIQSHVRKYICQRHYRKLLWATRTIQRHHRDNQIIKHEIESLRKKKEAAVVLQAAFRGMKARQTLTQKHQASVIIQSAYRAHRVRTRYLCMKNAAVAIQQRFCSIMAARNQREQFLRLRCAAIKLQACYRGQKVRREMVLRHRASTIIQATFRKHRELMKYRAMRLSAIFIQRYYRSYVEAKVTRKHYLTLQKSAIVLQAAFRGHSVRRTITEKHKAATVIQAAFRRHKQRSAFERRKWATSVLQQRYRAWKLGHQQRQCYQKLKIAALCLQRTFRGKRGRELVKQIKATRTVQSYLRMLIQRRGFLRKRAAAIVIQSAYRKHYCRVQNSRMQNSAIIIQQWYRSCKLVQKEQNKFKAIQNATLTLQRAVRCVLTRRHLKKRLAAVKIQSVLRMHIHRKRYLKLRSCALTLQSTYRMCRARRTYLKYQAAALTVQRFYRAYRAKREQRDHYVRTLKSVQTLQARVRGFIAFRRFQKMRSSAVTIQAFYRGLVERRKFQHLRNSVSIIQKHFKAYQLCQKEHAQFLKLKKTALFIQREFRAYQSRKIVVQTHAALKIQAWFRGCQVRRVYLAKQTAVAFVHRCIQTKLHRLRFQAVQCSVRVIQKRWRETLAARKQRAEFLRLRKSAIKMQAMWRGSKVRRSVQKISQAASYARIHRFAAAAYHHLCAVKIQRALRADWTLKAAKMRISSIIYIQQCFRAKLLRKRYLEQRQNIITLQRAVKGWVSRRNQAATVIQHVAKRFLQRKRKERVRNGIIKLQALWRGHCSRKLHDTTKVRSIRYRLRKINKEAKEEDKLCNKTTTALSYLLGYQNYAHILTALNHLETATRLSPECCEHLVNSGATCTLFILIRSCNRSVPSMEIISLAIQVLLNLSKYYKTIDAVYEVEDSVETLLDLLQMYREKAGDKIADKVGSIFTKACFLLVILVQDEARALRVRKLPKASDRLRRIYQLTLQKFKMDVKRTKFKETMNVSLNGSFLPSATPRKSKPPVRFTPDWVLQRGKMQNIVDPLGAIQMLVNTLALVP